MAALRQRLEEALLAAGETPITHPDKAPVHVNMRLTLPAGKSYRPAAHYRAVA
jgi:hypothetical protein